MTLTVHHLGNSQSERIVWLCEELSLPYVLKRYERDPSMAAPSEYKALHPAGTAPVVTDGDFVLAETGAIVEYLCRSRADGRLLLGSEDPGFGAFLFWFHFANGSMLPALMMEHVARQHGATEPNARLGRAFDLAEQHLAHNTWFAGDAFTAADIMMTFPLGVSSTVTGHDPAATPHVQRYLTRAAERPAYRAAMEKAEPERTKLRSGPNAGDQA
jgi:glutathione S-transferase